MFQDYGERVLLSISKSIVKPKWDGVAMRYLIFVVLMLASVVMLTQSASALPKCLKNPALARTGVLRDHPPCVTMCGLCNECCDEGIGTMTFLKVDDSKSPASAEWLTTAHALAGMDEYWIDGHKAEVLEWGCIPDTVVKCKGSRKGGCNWAKLVTYGYVPRCATPPALNFDGPSCCNPEMFYVNIGPDGAWCGDIRKMHLTCQDDSKIFQTNTRPECQNCGAGVYNHCDELIGIVVSGGKECGGTWTEVLRLHDGMNLDSHDP